jgi:hypothetical protein
MLSKSLLMAAAASWSLVSLGGAMVHVPILGLLSPLVSVSALIAFGLVFRFLPSPESGRRRKKVASVVTFFLGAAAIVAASIYSGSVVGDAIDAARKRTFGTHLTAVNPVPAAGAMIGASAIFAIGVWLRTPMAACKYLCSRWSLRLRDRGNCDYPELPPPQRLAEHDKTGEKLGSTIPKLDCRWLPMSSQHTVNAGRRNSDLPCNFSNGIAIAIQLCDLRNRHSAKGSRALLPTSKAFG